MSPALRIGGVGFGLIAVCYGFARFAFGLFLPQIDRELSLGPALAGVISGGSFLGYCLAIIASAVLTERFGARAVAVTAGLVAAAGMTGMAASGNALWLCVTVMIAGLSTGLASPPMAAAVAAAVAPGRQAAINATINAGTSVGVALSGLAVLAVGLPWRQSFLSFAALALLLTALAAFTLPSATKATIASRGRPRLDARLRRLVGAAFLTGAASTVLWSFGGQLAALRLGWSDSAIGPLWIAMGAAGIAGAGTGAMLARVTITTIERAFLILLAAGILAAGSALATPLSTLAGGALFGAAYVVLTGIYLVRGVAALPERPATGLMIAFLTLAIGQTAGAPAFGFLMDRLGPDVAVVAFAGLTLASGLVGTAGSTIARGGPQPCVSGG